MTVKIPCLWIANF